jgi:hypothetical protein
MSRITADKINKDAMVDKFTFELKKKDEIIKELKVVVDAKSKRIKELENESMVYTTDGNKIKKVLELKAKGNQYSVILDKMKFSSFDVTVEEIRDICLNVENLDSESQLYYKKQVEAFEESIKIKPELLKDALTNRYEFLYNEASIDLVNAVEVVERRRIRLEMKDHLKELNNVLKTIVDNDKEIDVNETLAKIAKGLDNTLISGDDSYEEFSMDKIEVM